MHLIVILINFSNHNYFLVYSLNYNYFIFLLSNHLFFFLGTNYRITFKLVLIRYFLKSIHNALFHGSLNYSLNYLHSQVFTFSSFEFPPNWISNERLGSFFQIEPQNQPKLILGYHFSHIGCGIGSVNSHLPIWHFLVREGFKWTEKINC